MSDPKSNKPHPITMREKLAYYDFLRETGCIDAGAEADFVERYRQEQDGNAYFERLADGSIPPHVALYIERINHAPPEGEDSTHLLLGTDFAIVQFTPKAGALGMPWVGRFPAEEAVITTFNPGGEKDWKVATTQSSPDNKGLLVQAIMSMAGVLDEDPPTQWTLMGQTVQKAVQRATEQAVAMVEKGKEALGEKPKRKKSKHRGKLIH